MNPLEELKKALTKPGVLVCAIDYYRVRQEIDAYATAHPGLVDLTTCGPQCPAWQKRLDPDAKDECGLVRVAASTGSPCPVMAKGGA